MKRQSVSHNTLSAAQASLVDSFSKKLAKNIHKTVENVETHIQNTVTKQLLKKTKFFQGFGNRNGAIISIAEDNGSTDNHEKTKEGAAISS